MAYEASEWNVSVAISFQKEKEIGGLESQVWCSNLPEEQTMELFSFTLSLKKKKKKKKKTKREFGTCLNFACRFIKVRISK